MSARRSIPSPGGVLQNGVVYEQIQVGRTVQYAVKTSKGVEIQPFLEVGEQAIYQPITPSPWLLPPKPIPYGTLLELWGEIRQFVYDHVDFEDDLLYDVYVAWVLATWTPEKFDSIGYLWFTGPRKSGKTRGLDVLNYVCFRPLLSPSASGPTIYRAMDSYQPTFLLDEFEMYQKMAESKAEVIGVLNAGYRRGQVVLRMTGMKEGTPMVKGFHVFGPKAISSIEPLPSALESRCIRFVMTRTFRKVRRMIDRKGAEVLRGKLLQYRFDQELEQLADEGNPLDLPDGRLIEMFYPLHYVAPTDEVRERIIKCARKQYNASIQEERAEIYAYVFHVIMDLLEASPRLKIPQREIRARYSSEYFEGVEIKPQTLGGWLKTMGFESEWDGKLKTTVLVVDMDKLENRKNRYALAEEMIRADRILESVRQLKASQMTLLLKTTPNTVTNAKEASLVKTEEINVKIEEIEGEIAKIDEKSSAPATPLTELTVLPVCLYPPRPPPEGSAEDSQSLDQLPHNTVNTVETGKTVNTVNTVNQRAKTEELTTSDSKSNLREKLEVISGALRGSKASLSTEEVAEAAGLEAEETLRLLEVLRRERHAFQVPGGKWRWVA